MYIHKLKKWPEFSWDHDSIATLLAKIHVEQGKLIGRMEAIGFSYQQDTLLQTLTQDVLKSSEIEGEYLDHSSVRSSVARHLRIETGAIAPHDKNVEGVVQMILDATQNFDQPLTKKRLLNWHTLLFPSSYSGYSKINVGQWRAGSVDVVSGRIGREVVHFEGPSATVVNKEINTFLNWINEKSSQDPLLKAAIAHLWFVTIHPFDDGNGRIGRAIADLLLARAESSSRRFYSLSAQIQKERNSYYVILEKTQKGNLDITLWLKWFLECLSGAINEALRSVNLILQKARFWEIHANIPLNERQRKIIHLMLGGFEGNLNTSKWAKLAKCSQDTAYRDILDLIDKGILCKNASGGRTTNYSFHPKVWVAKDVEPS